MWDGIKTVVGPAWAALLTTTAFGQSVVLDSILRHPDPPTETAPIGFGKQVAMGPNVGSQAYGTRLLVASRSNDFQLGWADLRKFRRVQGSWVSLLSLDDLAPRNPRPMPPTNPTYSHNDRYTIGLGYTGIGGSGNLGLFKNGGPIMAGLYNAPRFVDDTTIDVRSRGIVYGFIGSATTQGGARISLYTTFFPPGPIPFFEQNTQLGRVLVCGGDWAAVSQPGVTGRERVHVYGFVDTLVGYPFNSLHPTVEAPPVTSNQGTDRFGDSLAIAATGGLVLKDGWLAVGAPGEATGAAGVNTSPIPIPTAATRRPNAGAVYLYRLGPQNTVTLAATLKADNPDAGDEFGAAIAMDDAGETLFVGAPNEDSSASGINSPSRGNDGPTLATGLDRGAVYVFRRSGDTWALTDYLKPSLDFNALPSNQRGLHRFGTRLAVDGPHLAVQGGGISGLSTLASVYLFRRDLSGAWTTRQRLTPPATNWIGGARDFGVSLAMADGFLAVGAPTEGTTTGATGRGAVVMYSGIYDTPPAPPQPTAPVFSLPGGPSGSASLQWFGQPGADYRLMKSADLVNWTPVLTVTAHPIDGLIQVSDPAPSGSTFYYSLEKM